MRKKIVSTVLTAALAVSLLSMPVSAAEDQTISEAEEIDEEEPDEFNEEEFDIEIGSTDETDAVSEDKDLQTEDKDLQTEEQEPEPEELETDLEELAIDDTDNLGDIQSYAVTPETEEEDQSSMIATYSSSSTSNYDTIKVKGTINYSYAYEVLDLVNQERAAQGSPALTMDMDMLDAAMQRAAECSIHHGHTRPSGQSFYTVSSKVSSENYAVGLSSPAEAVSSWMDSKGHRENLLNSNWTTTGIGYFNQGNQSYWIQVFGTGSANGGSKSGSTTQTFAIEVSSDTITYLLLDPDTYDDSYELTVGDTMTLTGNVNATDILGSSFKWSSSNTSIATVDSSGKVTAVGVGNADITATTSTGQLSTTVTVTCVSGSLKKVNGVWGYYKNGKLQTNYTGFAVNESGKWYVENGIVSKKKNGVFKDKTGAIGSSSDWYYVLNSKVQTSFTGLSHYKNSSGWWYITKGKVDRSYTGLAKNQNGWFYVKNGKVDRSYTGFAKNSSGKWYVSGGKVTKTKNGVFKDKTGAIGTKNAWYYVINSKVQTSFTGLANYSNSSGWWYITKGKVDRSYTGLAKNKNGWFYLTNGKVNRSYTGLATNSNGTWYVKNGKVQKSFTGTVTINGKKYSVTKGKV